MDSPTSTSSQKQPHWRHSTLTPEHPGQLQKGRTTGTKKMTGQKPIPTHQQPKRQLVSTVVYQTPTGTN